MLEVRPTTNLDEIKAVLSHPAIWSSIASDGAPTPEMFDWTLYQKSRAIAGYVDGVVIAILLIHPFLDGDKVHINILPDYRKDYAKSFGDEAIQYVQMPAYADVPDIYPNVQRYTELFGFRPIEKIATGRTKNGEAYMTTRYMRAS